MAEPCSPELLAALRLVPDARFVPWEIAMSSKLVGRAHTLKQKRVILDALLVAWSGPGMDQQRLGQMLMNARPPRANDVFYLEDEDVLCALLRLAGATDVEVGVWVQQFRAAGEEAG